MISLIRTLTSPHRVISFLGSIFFHNIFVHCSTQSIRISYQLTTNLSLSIIVLSLWAIVNMVHSLNSWRIVLWINLSVSISTAAVASSKIRIFALCSNVLAKHTSWRCPTLHKSKTQLYNFTTDLVCFHTLLNTKISRLYSNI